MVNFCDSYLLKGQLLMWMQIGNGISVLGELPEKQNWFELQKFYFLCTSAILVTLGFWTIWWWLCLDLDVHVQLPWLLYLQQGGVWKHLLSSCLHMTCWNMSSKSCLLCYVWWSSYHLSVSALLPAMSCTTSGLVLQSSHQTMLPAVLRP